MSLGFARHLLRIATSLAVVTALLPVSAGVVARREGPPAVGAAAPEFSLLTLDQQRVSLSEARRRGPVVLVVSRGWVGYQCPFCSRQFGDFLRYAPEIEATGAEVIWVYPGPADEIRQRAQEFAEGRQFPASFRMVLDPDYTLTQAYDLRWVGPGETAYPSTFVIDRGGIVRYALVSRTHDGRAPAAAVLSVLRALPR